MTNAVNLASLAISGALSADANGNVGIGTTSPGEKLTVSGSGAAIAMKVQTTSSNAAFVESSANSGACVARLQANPTEAFVGTLTNSNFYIYTNGTERARITSAGYSKFSDNGTYYGSTGTFHEFYQSANDTGLAIKAANASYTNNGLIVDISRNTTNNSFSAISYYNAGAAAYKFRVADSGNVTNTNGSYGTIPSERRFKQDIVDASSQWDDIKNIRLRKYRMKADVEAYGDEAITQLGVIIDELEQVCPNLVEEHPVYEKREIEDENGNATTEQVLVDTVKGWKTSIVHLKALKALQEAMTRIETLEAEVAALKGAA